MNVHCTCTTASLKQTQTIPCHTSYWVHHDKAEFRQFMTCFNVHTATDIRLHLLGTRDRLSTWLRMRMVCWFRMRMLWHSLSSARGTIVGCGEAMFSLMSPLMCTFLDIEDYFVWVKTFHFGKCTSIHNRAGGATNVFFLLESASSQVIPENA
jgi:hypothetical protein